MICFQHAPPASLGTHPATSRIGTTMATKGLQVGEESLRTSIRRMPTKLAEFGPKSAEFAANLVESGPCFANSGQTWPKFK